ncbi:MAG: hypothetical protein D6762_03775 [Candidatus Neomarinimicrobiota bacterium]|nr:MAG: hypothetical protein D6762_03775 [Candidatus Neomarinimicrobiota bacterium]
MLRLEAINKIARRARRNWLLSYGDMITLLITFFIMLIIVRAGNVSRIHAWVNSQISEAADELVDVVEREGLEGIQIRRDTKGIHLILETTNMFDEGKALPKPGLRSLLNVLGPAIQNLSLFRMPQLPEHRQLIQELAAAGFIWNTEVRIEGHTDNVPLLPGSEYRDNWELSAARAQSILKILQKTSRLPESQFAVAGYGEYRPLTANQSGQQRARNRRVEIIITASLVKKQ